MSTERASLGDQSRLGSESWAARVESGLLVPGEAITVVTWNVYEGSDPKTITDQLELMDPSIALLQQVSRDQLDELSERFPQMHGSYIKSAHHKNGLVEGNLILSRFPIVDSYDEVLHRGARARSKGGRAAYQFYHQTTIQLDSDTTISVANVRAARLSFSGVISGGRETRILLAIIKERHPDILGGDISSLPKWKRMRRIFDETDLQNTGPNFSEKTWLGGKKLRKDSGLTRADYLLADEKGRVFGRSEIGKPPYISDHKPIIGQFMLVK